jgi:peptide/nickel transport system substrate-binding protein
VRRLLTGLVCILMLAACSRRSRPDYSNIRDKDTIVEGGTLVDETGGEASTLNPVLAADSVSVGLCGMIFDGLVRYNPKLQLEGELAEGWKVSDGGRTIIFTLRKGLKWQDGEPLTSHDVAFTYHVVMDPKTATPAKSSFEPVSSVETPDDLTFVAHYKEPFAPALESWGTGILPEHLLKDEKDINRSAFNRNPVGSGPYKFVRWADKQFVELEANPLYFEGKPYISRYVQRFIPEPATQLLELKTGGIDQSDLTPDQFSSETGGDDFNRVARKFRFDGRSMYTYMGFNLKKKPFDDIRVRLALSHAIDRSELINGVLQGLGKPCSGPYSPLMPAYNPDVKAVSYDLTESAKLLDEAGWKLGKSGLREKDGVPLKFRLITNQGNDARKKTVLILQQQFAKLGVSADVQIYEWSIFLKNYINTRDFDTYVMGWQLSLDPDLYPIWHSSQTAPEQYNMVSYKNLEVDRLLEQGRVTFEPAKRIAIYRRVHALIAKDQPYAFLYCPDELSALSLKIQGVQVTPTGYSWYAPNHWYIPASLQQ